eukprot:gene15416-18283_t
MKRFKTHFSGYSVEFSPFEEQRIACSTSQHFGIIGNGRQYVLDVLDREIVPARVYETRDGIYDCTWSEENECHLASASGDGSIKVWDTNAPNGERPIKSFEEHTKEVYSIDWNLVTKDTFVSGSWDLSIKIWNPRADRSLRTFREHRYCIYSTVWAPRNPNLFASVSGDTSLKIWDHRDNRSLNTIKAHDNEVLTCDWNKYNEKEIVTGSVDKTIRIWDIRYPDRPPENILLAGDMHIKVTDFGTGKILGDAGQNLAGSGNGGLGNSTSSSSTTTTNTDVNSNISNLDLTSIRSNSFVGTAEYVSPELISNKETSTDSDLWALGCIVYQLATGRLPFRGKTEFLTFQKISNRELVYPININPLVKDLIEKLLVIKPCDRLGSKSTGFHKLKEHPFFDGVEWETLYKQQPPRLVAPTERIVFDDPPVDLSSSGNSSNFSSPSSTSMSPGNGTPDLRASNGRIVGGGGGTPTTPTTTSTQDRTKWAQFLHTNEQIVESGLVWKKKGFSIKKRFLILTTEPRLIYIDPKKMEQKGEIPWSPSLKPEAKNTSNFVIQTVSRTTRLSPHREDYYQASLT